jgi:hypothetical protein
LPLFLVLILISANASAQDKIKFPISASSKTLGYSPLWVAQKQGFFERQGLDAQVVLVSGADKSTMALVGGSVYVGSGSIDATIGAVEQGADLITTGGVINGLTHMLMGGKKFKSYEDLRGANIGSSGITSGTAFVLRRMMAAKGLQYPKDYNLVNVGPSAQSYLALTANRVDAGDRRWIPMPPNSATTSSGAADIIPISVDRDLTPFLGGKNRPVMVRFMKVMVLVHWLYDNKNQRSISSPGDAPQARTCAQGRYYTEHRSGIPMPGHVEGVRGDSNHRRPRLAQSAAAGRQISRSGYTKALKELGARYEAAACNGVCPCLYAAEPNKRSCNRSLRLVSMH